MTCLRRHIYKAHEIRRFLKEIAIILVARNRIMSVKLFAPINVDYDPPYFCLIIILVVRVMSQIDIVF